MKIYDMEDIAKLLKKDHHILSKDYHDGRGRQYWLRNMNQENIVPLHEMQVDVLKALVKLKQMPVMSSDSAYILEAECVANSWKLQ
jgi:hypothetical protein